MLAASRPVQSVAVFSSRDTGSVSFSGRRCSVWYTNHKLCHLQGQRYCKSLVQLYVARQPAVNKKQCNTLITLYLSRSGPTFTSLDTFIHMAVSLHVQYVGHTCQVLHVENLHMSCVRMHVVPYVGHIPFLPIQNCSSHVATMSRM